MSKIKLYFLTGFLGSGKTTLANILAKFYEIKFCISIKGSEVLIICTLKTEQYESKSNIIEDKNLLFRF